MGLSLKKQSSISGGFKDTFSSFLFIIPFIILLCIFSIGVFISGAITSFTDAQGINPGEFIGFQNYIELVQTKEFWAAIRISFTYTLGCLLTQIPAAFVLAYILNNVPLQLRGILRASFFVPVLINGIVVAFIFRMLFNYDVGLINWILGLLHLPNNIKWTGDSSLTIPVMVMVDFWRWTGFQMVYFLAALQTIDPSLYEVAKLDGASSPRVLVQITLPMMRPAFTFVAVTAAIGGLQIFDLPYMLFSDAGYGPGYSARACVPYIYDQAFAQQFRLGFASAIGWGVFFFIMIVSLLQLRFLGLGRVDDE